MGNVPFLEAATTEEKEGVRASSLGGHPSTTAYDRKEGRKEGTGKPHGDARPLVLP